MWCVPATAFLTSRIYGQHRTYSRASCRAVSTFCWCIRTTCLERALYVYTQTAPQICSTLLCILSIEARDTDTGRWS